MELLYLSAFASILVSLVFLSFRYLSLLGWISGRAYVFSKNQEQFTAEEVMDLLKVSKPFPVSCHKGWKIDHVSHGHRVWFNYLTVPLNFNTASIKVFSSFCKLRASSQALLQIFKDIKLTCEWKPAVVATSSVKGVSALEISSKVKGVSSVPVKHDIITEERICSPKSRWFDKWWESNVTETTTQEYKRYWHREDNGCCWFLQMNEELQTWEFYLTQPVEGWFEVDQSLVTIATWNRHLGSSDSVDVVAAFLCSLDEYLGHRRLLTTPFLSISLPEECSTPRKQPLSENVTPDPKSDSKRHTKLLTKFKNFIERTAQGTSMMESQKQEFKLCSSILRFQSTASGSEGDIKSHPEGESTDRTDSALSQNDITPKHRKKALQRSQSDVTSRSSPRSQMDRQQTPDSVEEEAENIDPECTNYKVQANQAAAEVLAQALKASCVKLDKTLDNQTEVSEGWIFYSFDSDVVVLKRIFKPGSTVQSYLGKGLIQAPAQTVWDAVRNPRTRFTYDESLKKVDILETIGNTIKIVHMYHEVQQLLKKEACDICMLQSERVESDRYVLTYESVDYKVPLQPGTVRAKVLPSGWIIEPVRKDRKTCSMVTYLMQIDFGPSKSNSERYPFEEMVARQPLGISFLQQYLKPAVMMSRRKSAPMVNT